MTKKKNIFSSLKITYNAPVTLTFSLIAVAVLCAETLLHKKIILNFFSAPGSAQSPLPFGITNVLDYIRLIFHVFGHSDWNHLISNIAFILLLGPVQEEKYGSILLAVMMFTASVVSGVLNVCFSPLTLTGADSIAFMMILLTSFASIKKNEIPLSFILILILYIGKDIALKSLQQNITTLSHIAGGLCGSMFAFLATPGKRISKTAQSARLEEIDSQSPRLNQPVKKDNSTVVGTLKL